MKRRDVLRGMQFALGAQLLSGVPALAQAKYPDRPIRVIIPYAPGGVVDIVGRHWAERMRPLIGTMVIENQGGAGGISGTVSVARADADGYTLLFGDTSSLLSSPAMMPTPPYEFSKNFVPISIVSTSSTSIVVHPSVPASNLAEFIAYIRANPGKLSYASAGVGTATHLAGELFKQLIQAPDLTHIPYRGAGPGLTDLLAGNVQMMTPNVTNQVIEMHRTGKAKILAVCGPARLKAIAEVPAATETLPGMVVQLSTVVLAPAGTPAPIIDALAGGTGSILKDAEFIAVLNKAGLEVWPEASPKSAQTFLEAEREKLVKIIQTAGLKQP